ncbi:MAG: MerR family transcriptional regulator [Rheinheimera sp.]|nr:MerR family transcriptional regulator [Rheinheimera sp.]
MYIGELATLTGASPRAIRLYEAMQLLKVRRVGKYRVYDQSHVEFVQLIKQAQSLGILLVELQQLKRGDNALDWYAVQQLLVNKSQQLQQQMTALQADLQRIAHYQQLIASCISTGPVLCEYGLDSDLKGRV